MDFSQSSALGKIITVTTKRTQKGEALTKRRRKEVTWCQTPEAMILGICWNVLSMGANSASAIANRPSSCTNSRHPNSVLGDGAFSGNVSPHGANIVKESSLSNPQVTI